jgi:hypothetical protein
MMTTGGERERDHALSCTDDDDDKAAQPSCFAALRGVVRRSSGAHALRQLLSRLPRSLASKRRSK